jgi:hypothetical protein
MKTIAWILLINAALLFSQVLKVSVKVEYEHLASDEISDLINLGEKVEQYFNNYEWVEDEFEVDITCNARIIIETVQEKTFEKIYKAQFFISSVSGETFYDKVWEFPYKASEPFLHTFGGVFNPITHFLDYYAYMVLAGELDTYGVLLGNPLYEKALEITRQGAVSEYAKGWSVRNEQLLKITHTRTKPLREVKPNFFEALYFYEEGKYNEAYKHAQKVFEGISKVYKIEPNNKYLSLFFDAHHKEIAMLFENKFDQLRVLVDMDSKHRETYRTYLPGE